MFRPSLFQFYLTLCGLLLFGSLGYWQFDRMLEKEAKLVALTTAKLEDVQEILPSPEKHQRRLTVTGDYDQRIVLVDNQLRNNSPGYRVWTVLRLAVDQPAIVVDQGWLSQTMYRLGLPANRAGLQSVSGYWEPLPTAAFVDNREPAFAPATEQLPSAVVLQYPDIDVLQELYGQPLYNGRLIATDPVPDGYFVQRDFTPESLLNVTPERHLGYALTWTSFAGISVVLLLVFARRRARLQNAKVAD